MVQGIILAGGNATRLWPAARVVSKQLMPVYDKPMIYYPLSTLMSVGIREFLVITQSRHRPAFWDLLGDGEDFGVKIRYGIQDEPKGIAQALTIADEYAFLNADDTIVLILGDNLFAGAGVTKQLDAALTMYKGAKSTAVIFLKEVRDPTQYGVAVFGKESRIVGLVEKPDWPPPSNWAVSGLYVYTYDAVERVRSLKPSARDELEITDLNNAYLLDERLAYRTLGRNTAWLDTGTPETLLQASSYVAAVQERHGTMVGCPEEIAFARGWINEDVLERRGREYMHSQYGTYLLNLMARAKGGERVN